MSQTTSQVPPVRRNSFQIQYFVAEASGWLYDLEEYSFHQELRTKNPCWVSRVPPDPYEQIQWGDFRPRYRNESEYMIEYGEQLLASWEHLSSKYGADSFPRLIRKFFSKLSGAAPDNATRRAVKGKKIGDQMAALMVTNPEAGEWTAREWAEHLACSAGTVCGLSVWTRILKMREMFRNEAVERRKTEEGLPRGRRAPRG